MVLYLELTYWSGKEHVLGERVRGMKLGFRKCPQADVGRTAVTNGKYSHKFNKMTTIAPNQGQLRRFMQVRKNSSP